MAKTDQSRKGWYKFPSCAMGVDEDIEEERKRGRGCTWWTQAMLEAVAVSCGLRGNVTDSCALKKYIY